MMKLYSLALLILLSVFTSFSSLAASGTVILARGVVTATDASSNSRVLAKGGRIDEGDVINTAKKSFAVIRMLDNTKLTLKPDTTIAIGKFNAEKGKEEACINLVKGGLRTVTGLIGKRKPESFNVDTPIASIGIRGTDFITRICADDECLLNEQALSFGESAPSSASVAEKINKQLPEGLYSSCETGAIVMSQCAGQAEKFEIGKCRIAQKSVCTEVELGAGQAGYTGFDPLASDTNALQKGSAAALPKPPIKLPRTPKMLSRDPYFALSDLNDQELQQVERAPEHFNTSGQCSIYGV